MKRAVPYAALLICAGCGYLGYYSAARIVYQHKQSAWFSSLEKPEAEQLRKTGQTTLALSLSSILIQNNPSSIQHQVSSLAKIRSQAPQEFWPILDLRLAKDYAMMARLERQTGESKVAAEHEESAKLLLRSLGWLDVSDNALADLADRQFRSRMKR
jgi:hypothetical protein